MGRKDRTRAPDPSPSTLPTLAAAIATPDAIEAPAVVPVAAITPPPRAETVDASRVYRVRGPGSVILRRRTYAPGDSLTLEPHEALDLAAHIEPA